MVSWLMISATMRQHPISPVTEPMQYRAIGVVQGTYVPADPDRSLEVIQTRTAPRLMPSCSVAC